MSTLVGRLVSQAEVKANGDVFHELYAHRPHHLANTVPDIVQSYEVIKGSWGTVGSVVHCKYTHEGRKKEFKAVIEAADDNKKSITYKFIEGDVMQLYTTYSATIHVDTQGGRNTVTWIMDYVKLSPNMPDPNSIMDLVVSMTKGIDAKHSK